MFKNDPLIMIYKSKPCAMIEKNYLRAFCINFADLIGSYILIFTLIKKYTLHVGIISDRSGINA